MDKAKVGFNLFGKFEIIFSNETFDLTHYLGKQLINLLMVLIMSKNHEASKETLIDLLWKDSENPHNVMKFTVFRLRKDLQRLPCLKDIQLVTTTKNGYALSNDYVYDIDLEHFMTLKNTLQTYNQAYAEQLVHLYQGHIYSTSTQPLFVREVSEQCQKTYNCILLKLCQDLSNQGAYQKMLDISYRALEIEASNEPLHYLSMLSLIKLGKNHKARQYYEEVKGYFYRENKSQSSAYLDELYALLASEDDDKIKDDLSQIEANLNDDKKKTGGFYCGYELFKYIRRLLVEKGDTSHTYYLVLFELQCEGQDNIDKTLMIRFKYLLMNSISTSDIFTKVKNNQYVLLLRCKHKSEIELMIHHITSEFYKKYASHKYRLAYSTLETKQG